MLVGLYIQNIAVISRAQANFEAGLNVLTGETGAGKSLIIDSINMALGERTHRELIRTGEDRALVEAVFCLPPESDVLENTEIPPEEDGTLIISREIFINGRNICKINGRIVTLSQLKELGRQLISIHGQQDSQALLDSGAHLKYVDALAGNAELLRRYRAAHEECVALKKKIDSLDTDEAERLRKIDLLTYQVNEIEAANLSEDEEDALKARRAVLENASIIREGLERAARLLSGETQGARDTLVGAREALGAAAAHDGTLEEYVSQIDDMIYQAEDIAHELKRRVSDFADDPGALTEVEARLDVYYRLRKKYGETVSDVLSFYAEAKEELERIKRSTEDREKYSEELEIKLKEREELAGELSLARKKAGESLKNRVMEELNDLNMGGVLFEVKISPCEYKSNGADDVEFYLATGPGEPLRPLSRIASGGEMSRICLALKTALSGADGVPTMIFDEIDTGVGGQAGVKIAQKLRALGSERQILCITHLPQIAAAADHHFLIEKLKEGGRFLTRVKRLGDEERVLEIARMTSGENLTEINLKNAGEMLSNARKNRP